MKLSHLTISNFRNLKSVEIVDLAQFNYFIGENGSGKTSLLEALYCLALGKSFRTPHLSHVIHHQAHDFNLFTELQAYENQSLFHKIGIGRARRGKSKIKINGDSVEGLATLAQLFPILLLYNESYALFRDSPKTRRKWLDWGMFHVEPLFFPLWKRMHRILMQRNALLKQQASLTDIMAWDGQFIEVAEHIHRLRETFITEWQKRLAVVFSYLFGESNLSLVYSPGWDLELGLNKVLENGLNRDRSLGYTTRGPHRADIQIYQDNIPVHQVFSLGQQKLLVCAIILSQVLLLQDLIEKKPVLLIDDLLAELDEHARAKIASIILDLPSQVFLTAIDLHTLQPFLDKNKGQMFHVEHGMVKTKGDV